MSFFIQKRIYAFNIARWKRALFRSLFPSSKILFLRIGKKGKLLQFLLKRSILYRLIPPESFYVWGMQSPSGMESYAQKKGISITRFEDGFVRSLGLGSHHVLPFSFCTDDLSMHYASKQESRLERILNDYDFASDKALMKEAQKCFSFMRTHQITKYNLPKTSLASKIYGEKTKKRILCMGQVESDESIRYGQSLIQYNNELVAFAAKENPGAQIIYKVHPDVYTKKQKDSSSPKEISHLALLVEAPMSFDDALSGVDKVYVMSSLAGFESLVHGVPVATLGLPFYSGWGLTEDHVASKRRKRKLTLLELFAGAYLLYPIYFQPNTGEKLSFYQVLQILKDERQKTLEN